MVFPSGEREKKIHAWILVWDMVSAFRAVNDKSTREFQNGS